MNPPKTPASMTTGKRLQSQLGHENSPARHQSYQRENLPVGRFYLWGLYSDVVYVSDQSTMELKQGDDEEKRMAETRTERASCDPTPKTGRSRM